MTRKMFLSLLVALAAGCSADAAHEPNASSADAQGAASLAATATDQSLATVAPRRDASGSAAGVACAAGETILFACETLKGKRIALCASRDVGADHGYLYYVYGAPGRPELTFPDARRPPVEFKRTQLGFVGSTGGYAYSFENKEYRYIVYSVSGAEGLEDQGVLVTRGDTRKAVSSLSCRKGSVREDDDAALLDLTFTWPADPDLEQHGLPTRNLMEF